MDDSHTLQEFRERRPSPDPTTLTTEALKAAVTDARAQLARDLNSLEKVLEARIQGLDRVISLMQVQIDRIPPEEHAKLQAFKDIVHEKFQGIGAQFAERDARVFQDSKDHKAMVDGAVQAAKDMIRQSETLTAKQLEQIMTMIADVRKILTERTEATTKRTETAIDALQTKVMSQEHVGRHHSTGHPFGPWVMIVIILGAFMVGMFVEGIVRWLVASA